MENGTAILENDMAHSTKLNILLPSGSSVQLLSRVQLFVTPWTEQARPPCPSPNPGVYSNSFMAHAFLKDSEKNKS